MGDASNIEAIVKSTYDGRLREYKEKVRKKFQRGREKFRRKREGSLVGPLCSQNPHDEIVVVRRAQWWTKSGHPPGGDASEL
jgi:hypothetical protein